MAITLAVAAVATHQLTPPSLDESLEPTRTNADPGDGTGDRAPGHPSPTSDIAEGAPAGPVASRDAAWSDGATTEAPTASESGEPATGPVGTPLDDELDLQGPPVAATPGQPGAGREWGSGSRSVEPVLRLIYFVEADREFDPDAVDAIERQAVALQRYWYDQFGGTFRLPAGGVDVVHGDHPARWYEQTDAGDNPRWNRLTNIRDEVRRELGLPDDPYAVRTLTFPEARIDGLVGANRYEGAWMDGDDISCVSGLVETTPYTFDYPASCLATVAHELGHVYGLGHVGPDEDCMQYGFYRYISGQTLCDFGPENRAVVQADPRNVGWLDAIPGDRG